MAKLEVDILKELEKAKKAANEAMKPYGFRLLGADNCTFDTDSGIGLYVDCKIVLIAK